MGVRRGDLVTAVVAGDYGKPRPALVVQSDVFSSVASVMVVLLTSDLTSLPVLFRTRLVPTPENGLKQASDIMVDKLVSLPRERLGYSFGRVDDATLSEVSSILALLLGL